MRKIALLTAMAALTGGLAACGIAYGDGPTLAGISGGRLTLRYNPAKVSAAKVAAAAADYCPDQAPVPHLVSRIPYQPDAVYAEFDCAPAPKKTPAKTTAPAKAPVKKTASK